jgi:hypothetical protein
MLSSFSSCNPFCSASLLPLCSVRPLHAICCTTHLYIRLSSQTPSTNMPSYREKHSLFSCSSCLSHAKSSTRSSSQLFVFSVVIPILFIMNGHYAEILWLLWQLQSSILFHLSIVSMINLHTTGSYLETLQLLWQST